MRSNVKWVVSVVRLTAVVAFMMLVNGRAVTQAAQRDQCIGGDPNYWLAITHGNGSDEQDAYGACEAIADSTYDCDGVSDRTECTEVGNNTWECDCYCCYYAFD